MFNISLDGKGHSWVGLLASDLNLRDSIAHITVTISSFDPTI